MEMMTGQSRQDGNISRHELVEELSDMGINGELFKSVSIDDLRSLVKDFQEAINSSKAEAQEKPRAGPETAKLSSTDMRILKALVSSSGRLSSLQISRDLDIPLSTIQRRRKRLEATVLEVTYGVKMEELGWRRALLFISTQKGRTESVGKEILSWNERVLSVVRTMGQNGIDLFLECLFKNNQELLRLMERVKMLEGVNNVFWSESIQVIGKKSENLGEIFDSYAAG